MDSALLILIVLLVLLAVSVVVFIVLVRRSQRSPEESPSANTRAAREKDRIAEDVRDAVTALRDRVPAGKSEERVPWILLLGEPGAGKTTLLDQMASGSTGVAVPKDGVQWRFLDGGALIDVPGTFLIDAEGKGQADGRWNRLLRVLLRHRPSRPVDGIVLAIPASQLLATGETESVHMTAIAAALRSKLDDLQKLLGLVVPIYVLVTKCDLIRGFGSFCWEINPDLDDDVFGWSNPNTLESAFAADWVDHAFNYVGDGILQRQIRIFGSRAPSPSGDELFLFPMELDRMRSALRGYLSQIFRETSYLDSNYLRGIYFCGDASVVLNRMAASAASAASAVSLVPAAPTALTSMLPPAVSAIAPARSYVVSRQGMRLVFARHLFDFKVFFESKLARPVTRTRFARNRTVLCTQIALAIFIVVFTAGTVIARNRLVEMRDHKFLSLLDALRDTLPVNGGTASKIPSVQTAYDLVDTLGTINASGFRSFFLPPSWNDPIGARVADALTHSFGVTVFPAIRQGLEMRADDLLQGCAVEAPQDDTDNVNAENTAGIAPIAFTNDPQYAALEQFLTRFNNLDSAIRKYDNVRGAGDGSFADLDSLFHYLVGKNLSDARKTTNSLYYQRAISEASGEPVPITRNDRLNECAQMRGASLIDNFYSSWLDNNPLLMYSKGIADQIDSLNQRKTGTKDDLSSLALDIRDLDTEVSTSSARWLTGPDFDPSVYPALNQLRGTRFATEDFITSTKTKGSEALARLKGELFSTETEGIGTVLEVHGAELHVSGAAISLELALSSLLNQDFMQIPDGGTTTSTNVIWNKSTLGRAGQLKDSYEKFVRERLSLLPPVLRTSVQRIASQNMIDSVKATVTHAQEPQSLDDETTTLLEIRSFKEAVPVLTQLQESIPGKILPPQGSFSSVLSAQGVALAQRLNTDLDSTYPYSVASIKAWDGTKPLSWLALSTDSADGVEQYLGSERDRIKSLALDYAQPLASYLQPQGLQQAAKFDRWPSVIKDVQDYDAKKPGNPMAALETFVRSDLDKITPANACRPATTATAQASDYFLRIRADLQRAAVSECSGAALRAYTSGIADFFQAKLAGKFPFGPLPAAPGTSQADPQDTARFLSLIAQRGPALVNYLSQKPAYGNILAFINQSDAVRQMFAGGVGEGDPFADVAVYFRANPNSEQGGNEIIDWELESGDQRIHYPGATNGLRWHYGDTMRLTMRYAKDSPNIPQPGGAGSDARVDGRTVTWTYSGGWSLFALLASHAGTASDFGTTPDALASTMRFVIPTLLDTTLDKTRIRPPAPAAQPGETRVYIRLGLRIPGAKDTRETPIVSFPESAPPVPAAAE